MSPQDGAYFIMMQTNLLCKPNYSDAYLRSNRIVCSFVTSVRSSNSQVPRPTFGSGSGLQCVYTVVISLWGTPAPKFVLEPPKTVFYWILLCIRKPQAEFQKFSSTHVSPSNRFISSPQLPLLVGTKDEEYLPIWTLYFSVHVSLHFFVDDLP